MPFFCPNTYLWLIKFMNENKYMKILYDAWLENLKESDTVKDTITTFHQYLQKLELTQQEKDIIENYNGTCIAVCENFAFQAGFRTACQVIYLTLIESNIN